MTEPIPKTVITEAVAPSGNGSPAVPASAGELIERICPNCDAALDARSCKLLCPRCGYFKSCSDF